MLVHSPDRGLRLQKRTGIHAIRTEGENEFLSAKKHAPLGIDIFIGGVDEVTKSRYFFKAMGMRTPFKTKLNAIVKLAQIYDYTLDQHDLVRLTIAIAALRTRKKMEDAYNALHRNFGNTGIGTRTINQVRKIVEMQVEEMRDSRVAVELDIQ